MQEGHVFSNEKSWKMTSQLPKKIEHKTLSNEIKQVSWDGDIEYFSQRHKVTTHNPS